MQRPVLECVRCGAQHPADAYAGSCRVCAPQVAAALTLRVAPGGPVPDRHALLRGPRSMWRFAHCLPVPAEAAVSLGEGLTPMLRLDRLGPDMGVPGLMAKNEGANPTGSFKDRLASTAISSARHFFDSRVVVSSSTGNAGVAAAAYAARAGLRCVVLITPGVAPPMLAQLSAFGAVLLRVQDKPARWTLMAEAVRRLGWFPTSPFTSPPFGSNPYGVEGYKTLAWEIAQDMDWDVPEWIIAPVCYGDALFGMWKGFDELLAMGWIRRMPRLVAAEIYGSLGAALASGEDQPPMMPQPYATAAGSITSGQSTHQALAALRRSDGRAIRVAEAAFAEACTELSRREGLFVEQSAAVAVAAAATLARDPAFRRSDRVVTLLTAEGLKDRIDVAGLEPGIVDVGGGLDQALATLADRGGPDLMASPSVTV